MRLGDVAMIAADTSRSRLYMQALVRNDMLPAFVLVLAGNATQTLPGQQPVTPRNGWPIEEQEECWSEAVFDRTEPLHATLERSRTPFEVAGSADINDEHVISAIERRPETTFIYSGYGGALLRAPILRTGKQFLHVHGGYLPDFKGSTTNYYSLLVENTLGASSLFLTEEIDSGPVLCRRRFPPPPDRTQIDHTYDAAARAKVLIDTLGAYVETGTWGTEPHAGATGETYFIIHPVLKHIAMLSEQRSRR